MNTQQCIITLEAIQSGCQSSAEFWAAISELSHRHESSGAGAGAGAGPEPKKRGPKPLAERSVEEQAAHAAKKAARAAVKAASASASVSASTSAASSDIEGSAAPKKRGPKPLAERSVEEQAAHAAAKLAKAALKAVEAASASASASGSDTEAPKKAKKVKKVKAEGSAAEAPKEKKPPSAWNLLVTQTVSEMKQGGWQSWTDAKGVVWPDSKMALVKGSEQHVFNGGTHDGKLPSPALGGMARASWLKTHVPGLQGEWAEIAE